MIVDDGLSTVKKIWKHFLFFDQILREMLPGLFYGRHWHFTDRHAVGARTLPIDDFKLSLLKYQWTLILSLLNLSQLKLSMNVTIRLWSSNLFNSWYYVFWWTFDVLLTFNGSSECKMTQVVNSHNTPIRFPVDKLTS